MTVTKLAKLSEIGRMMYISYIDKLDTVTGLRVYGFILSASIFRSVEDTSELQSVKI